jgi:hypothetical protein
MGDGGRARARPRAAGRVSAPGRRGGGASQQAAASGRAASDRGVGEGGRRDLRIADTHLPARGGAEDGLLEGPVRSRARLVLAGDAVGTGKGCIGKRCGGEHVCGSGHAHQSGLVEEGDRLIIVPTRRQSRR